ncbi:MAG: hypothetical protein KZQ57_09820 [gamma proteobacterium symbiont of Lucinoma myriamae]|nr:hypothetical protein [gamma proteobacterium symbiont of Lucinoma myriamae]
MEDYQNDLISDNLNDFLDDNPLLNGQEMNVTQKELMKLYQGNSIKGVEAHPNSNKTYESGWSLRFNIIKGGIAYLYTQKEEERVFTSFASMQKLINKLCPDLPKITVYFK